MPSIPSQLEKPIIYSAVAGSGKTTKLVDHVFQVVETFHKENKRYPRVVVTTFTKKATQELRERLTKKAIEEGSQDLIQFTLSKSNLMVTTIDGLLNLFIKRYGIQLEIDSDFRFITERESKKEAKKILKKIMESQKEYAGLLEDYSLGEINESLIKLERETLLSSSGWSIYDFQTLEEEVWKEYCDKVGDQLESLLGDLGCCGNLTSSWETLQQNFKELLNKNTWQDVYKYINEASITKRGLSQSKSVPQDLKDRADIVIDSLKKLRVINYDPKFWKKAEKSHQVFQKLSEEFNSKLWDYRSQMGCLTESDLGPVCRYLLKKYPECAKRFSQEWDYWLIDEFQDTSPSQVEMLREFIGKRSHFLVGDSQQSIYLFRGARPYVFDEKMKEIELLGGEVNEKGGLQNYRSNPSLIAFINQLFQKMNPEQFKIMKPAEGKSFDPKKNVANFYISEKQEKTDKEKKVKSEEKEKGEAADTEKEDHEGGEIEKGSDDKTKESKKEEEREKDFICKEIIKISKNFPEKKIAILCRTNRQAEEVDRFLSQKGLVTQITASGVFGERREVQDLIQITKVLINPHDDLSLVGVLRSPWFFVEPSVLTSFSGRKKSLWSEIKDKNIESIELLKSYQEKAQTVGLTETLVEIVLERGLLKSSFALDPTGQKEANICKFISLLKLQDHRSDFNCLEFIANMELDNKEEDAVSSVESQRVHIMTIHKAKGLEFDYVFIPFIHKFDEGKKSDDLLEFNEDDKKYGLKMIPPPEIASDFKKKRLPPMESWRKKKSEWKLSELERLFYVAVTRAKEEVWLTGRGKTKKDSILKKIIDSGFFNDLNAQKQIMSTERKPLSSEEAVSEKHSEVGIKEPDQKKEKRFTCTVFSEPSERGPSVGDETLSGGENQQQKNTLLKETELSDSSSCKKTDEAFDDRKKEGNILKPIEWKWTSGRVHFQSVSDLVRQGKNKEGISQEASSRDFLSSRKLLPTDKINYIEKTLRGTQIHADLEELSYQLSGGGEINSQLLRKEWVQYVWKLKDPPMEELLKNGNPEWPYLYRKDNIITEGRIDLWGDVDNVRWIVDYKTGAVHKEEGFQQMAAYAEALDSKHSVKDVRLVLLYPLTEKVYSKNWKSAVP